jgi:hypothetical protein
MTITGGGIMRYAVSSDCIFIRPGNDEELLTCIATACEEYSIDSAVVVTGLGMLKEVTFGWYTGTDYAKEDLVGPFELSALSGNVSIKGASLYPHLHAVINKSDHRPYSGHILRAICYHNLEITLIPLNTIRLRREHNGWFEAIVPEKR